MARLDEMARCVAGTVGIEVESPPKLSRDVWLRARLCRLVPQVVRSFCVGLLPLEVDQIADIDFEGNLALDCGGG
jgi:hypothetical protein